MVERFEGKFYATHVLKLNKHKQTKTLHVMEETINSTPIQKTIEEANILHHTLLEARPLSHILEQEGMEIPFSKEDLIIGRLPIHIDEDEGNNAVMSRVYKHLMQRKRELLLQKEGFLHHCKEFHRISYVEIKAQLMIYMCH